MSSAVTFLKDTSQLLSDRLYHTGDRRVSALDCRVASLLLVPLLAGLGDSLGVTGEERIVSHTLGMHSK